MPSVYKPDPFRAVLLSSPKLTVTEEQQRYIREILETACSDSRFAQKAYDAIWLVLTSDPPKIPTVGSLTPTTVEAGSPAVPLQILGLNFTPGSTALIGGVEKATEFISATELMTTVDPSGFTQAAQVPVSVLSDNGILSDPSMLSVTAPAAPLVEETVPPEE